MLDAPNPRFRLDQPVRAALDLRNDGSYPDAEPEALLAAAGSVGDVLRIGRHTEAETFVYLVDFGGRVLGCAEHELLELDAATADAS